MPHMQAMMSSQIAAPFAGGLRQCRNVRVQASQQLHAHRHAVRCNSSAEGTSYFSTPPCSGGLSLGSSASTHCIVASAPESSLLTCRVASRVPLTDVEGSGGDGGGNGVGGNGNNGNGGNWEGGANEGDDEDSTLLNQQEAELIASSKGIQLPADFLAAALAGGLRQGALLQYLNLQRFGFSGWLARTIPFMRDRMLADPRFLFIVCAEVGIDAACATVAEVRKRGADFWDEFEFYLSDLVVGCVLDVVLVGLMAPAAALTVKKSGVSGLQQMLDKVPSAVFSSSMAGRPRYGPLARVSCLAVKFLEYSLAGIVCGFIGQGIANGMMQIKRHYDDPDKVQLDIPPVGKTALTWGLFMGVSSNVRYQIVFGLERLVDKTLAKSVPRAAYVTSFGLRFVNNVIGGENFIDMARWAGIQ